MDLLLEMPEDDVNGNAVTNFCRYASSKVKSRALINAFSRMFGDDGNVCDENWVDFGAEHIMVFDKKGMGFVVDGKEYPDICINGDTEDILYIMRILCREDLLAVLRLISMDKAVTREEICDMTGLDMAAVNQILTGFFKRGMVVCEKDGSGKRGYLHGDAMAGIYMILAGCQVLSDSGAINGYKRFARMSEKTGGDKS